jgi:hypothetical protein
MCTGKRSRSISLDSLHEPSKKLRHNADHNLRILYEEKAEISYINIEAVAEEEEEEEEERRKKKEERRKKKEVSMIIIMLRSFLCRAETI